MTEPQDPFDTWLHAQVEPLAPPPGTFQRIRKRARRRKARRAVLTAGSAGVAAALIVLAVVALPRLVPSVLHLNSHPVGNPAADRGPSASPGHRSQPPAASTSPAPGGTGQPPVPPDFAATSVTFANMNTGWVIGQAGTPGHCDNADPYICTSVARTDDAGQTWHGGPAPSTGAPDGGNGVSQIRFLGTHNGWAFGPQLWATHDGGASWRQVNTDGMRVTSLETVDGEAFAVFASCSGGGSSFAADCTRFTLYSSPAGTNAWQPVFDMSPYDSGGQPGSATVIVTQGQGYFYTPSGTLVAGPVTGNSAWQPVSATALPCAPGPAQPDGQPSDGQLAASSAEDLALACPGSGGQAAVWVSSDGGQRWRTQGSVSVSGTVTSLAASSGGLLVLAGSGGLEVSSDDGLAWHQAPTGVSGGFSYVGMTNQRQGVAVPADASLDSVWFTYDSGQNWQRSRVQNP